MENTVKSQVLGERRRILEAVAARLNASGIRYAVLHGVDGYPAQLGRDIDLCVNRQDRSPALNLIVAEYERAGWLPVVYRTPWAEWVVGCKNTPVGIIGVEIDLLSRMQWGWALLARDVCAGIAPTAGHPFPSDRWIGFVKRVLIQLLSRNFARFQAGKRHAGELTVLDSEMETVEARLSELIGSRWTAHLLSAIKRTDLQWLAENIKRIRRALLLRAWKHPLELLQTIWLWIGNETAESIFPATNTPVVGLYGPPEVVSAVAEKLSSGFSERFIFTSIETQRNGCLQNTLRSLYRRRIKSSRLVLSLVLFAEDAPPRRSVFQWISPLDLMVSVDSAEDAAVRGYERRIVECFQTMNGAAQNV